MRLGSSGIAELAARVGADAAPVRIRTDREAGLATLASGATAMARGSEVWFAPRAFRPHSREGRRLIAHELAHVAQQQSGRAPHAFQRQEMTLEERRRRIAELEAEAARPDVTPERLTQINEERNALARALAAPTPATTSSPPAPASSPPAPARTVAEIEAEASRPGVSPERLAELNRERNRVAARSTSGPESAPAAPVNVDVGVTYEAFALDAGTAEAGAGAGGGVLPAGPGAGGGQPAPLAYVAPAGEPGLAGPVVAGASPALGNSLLALVDPLVGTEAIGDPSVYTRFAGRGLGNLTPELQPRLWQGGGITRMEALSQLERAGVRYPDLTQLSRALRRPGGVAALTAEEAGWLRTVVRLHAVEGQVGASPLLSLTEHPPNVALSRLPPVAQGRTYIVRVRIASADVIRVNEALGRAGRTAALASELEVVVGRDLIGRPGQATPGVRIMSVRANPHPSAPLGGAVGPALRWAGRGLVVLGAGVTVAEVVTAQGPHKRETQGTAFGAFAGGTMLGAFGAGFCIGAGIATGGIAIALCGLGFGLVGAAGGGYVGGRVGGMFD